MTEETAPAPDPTLEMNTTAPAPDAGGEEGKAKKAKKAKGKERGARAARKPSFKDWIRVQKSQGNTCNNTQVHLIINEATNVVTLVTNAPAKEGSEEMEGERRQIFKITSHEVINVPDPESEAAPETAPE